MLHLYRIITVIFFLMTTSPCFAQEFFLRIEKSYGLSIKYDTLYIGFDSTASDMITPEDSARWGERHLEEDNSTPYRFRLIGDDINRKDDLGFGSKVDIRKKPDQDSFVLKYELTTHRPDSESFIVFHPEFVPISPRYHIYISKASEANKILHDFKKGGFHSKSFDFTDTVEKLILMLYYNMDTSSGTTGVANKRNNKSTVHVSPNPYTDIINLSVYSQSDDKLEVIAVDMLGRVLYNSQCIISEGENFISLNVKDISSKSKVAFLKTRLMRSGIVQNQLIIHKE